MGYASAPSARAAFEAVLGTGNLTFLSGGNALDATMGIHLPVLPWLQGGVTFNYQAKQQETTKVRSIFLFVGPTANFGAPAEAFFMQLALAYRSGKVSDTSETDSTSTATTSTTSSSSSSSTDPATTTTDNPDGIGGALFFGKRFPLFSGVLYRPNVGLVLVGAFGFILNPVQLSYQF